MSGSAQGARSNPVVCADPSEGGPEPHPLGFGEDDRAKRLPPLIVAEKVVTKAVAILPLWQRRGPQPASQMASERDLMVRAISQSRSCNNEPRRVSPKVGAVVARDGRVVGEAFRGELAPGEHAEYTLLERKLSDETLAGSVPYTTLEPCTSRNYPKAPCVARIVERRISKIFIGILDPSANITVAHG